jgi:hypothetical protein
MKRLGTGTAVWFAAAALAAAMAFAAPAQAVPPTGAVTWSHQWCDAAWCAPPGEPPQPMTVDIHARSSSGSALLDSAQVLINGAPATVTDEKGQVTNAPLALCDPERSCDLGRRTVRLDTSTWADGAYHFVVAVTNADGESANIADGPFTVNNANPNHPTADLTIGSSVSNPQPQTGGNGGQGGVEGAGQSSCASAKLSMLLSQKPVRISHRVPVLYKNKKYRFSGRLTCLVRGKRISATKGTKVEIYAIVKGRTVHKATARVASGGKVTIRLASPSARTLEFRFKGADGKTARVRIKIKTVKPPKKHTKHHT